MLRIDNSQYNLASKGYVHKSLYKHIEKDFINSVTKLRKEHYRFKNIPLIDLNRLQAEKNEVVKNLKQLEEVMAKNYDAKTYVLPVKELSKNGKESWQLHLGNELFPDVTVPIIYKTKFWSPESILPRGARLDAYTKNLTSEDTIKNTEIDLLKSWLEKKIKKHCSNSIYDRAIRKFFAYNAIFKAKQLNIKNVNIPSFVDVTISRAVERHNINSKNKVFEKDFMKSLKF